ncbi:MAG TPA: cytochrome c3 family protein [Kofleriaceae bacterium]|jgi:c(7)-type cytochrome triheme protein
MRALAALAIFVVLGGIAVANPPTGFDHTLHERDVIVAGGDSIACARCHELDKAGRLVGKPGHAACFGDCHGATPKPPRIGATFALDDDRKKLCTECHADNLLAAPYAGRMPVPYPPYTIERDFNLALGHKQHAAAPCTQCHDLSATAKPAPHARCASCHDGAKATAMTACKSCHLAATGKPQPPELRPISNSIGAIFSHAKHAARSKEGRECTTCHASIAQTDDTELPRPTAADCARCHDGTRAFSTTIACTRCHAPPPANQQFEVVRPQARFSHAGPHAQLVAGTTCATCHALGKNGDAQPPNHAACTTGCHTHVDDFGARAPTTCGACHIGTEPWRHLLADRPPPDATELGATLDHTKHPGQCTACHVLRTSTAELQLPRSHAACTGAACHAQGSGPAPQLDACDGCHRLGRAAARIAQRAADPWSVRATFQHSAHTAAACTACHTDLHGADVVELPTPAKPTCAPCHDGRAAFSLTGTTCRKCHSH